MALAAASVFEVRTAGLDTNGGGFVTGAAGTDYSQQDAKNSGGADSSVTDGVSNGTTTVTSATAAFGTTIVGNIIYIAGGTGAITGGWYQVTARASSTSITVDRSTGLTAGTGATINIGGALLTHATALTLNTVAGIAIYVKADGTYSIGTGLTDSNASSTTLLCRIIGYTTTRGDNGKVTLQASAAITMLTVSAQGHLWENHIIDGNAATATNGINVTGGRSILRNLIVKNFTGYGVQTNSATMFYATDVEITGCAATAAFSGAGGNTFCRRMYIHDNTIHGALLTGGNHAWADSVIETNTGASTDGIQASGHSLLFDGLVLYANGRDGIRVTSGSAAAGGVMISNTIFASNTGFAVNFSTAGSSTAVQPVMEYNAYLTNTRNGYAAEFGAVTLSVDPFTNAAAGDFTLNNTAGGGAACRGAGSPTTINGATGTGYRDIGAFQHQDPAGGGGPVSANMRGGFVN